MKDMQRDVSLTVAYGFVCFWTVVQLVGTEGNVEEIQMHTKCIIS